VSGTSLDFVTICGAASALSHAFTGAQARVPRIISDRRLPICDDLSCFLKLPLSSQHPFSGIPTMRSRILKAEAPVCQLCSFIATRPSIRARSLQIPAAAKSLRQFSVTQKASANKHRISPSSNSNGHPAVAKHYDGARLSGAVNEAQIGGDLRKAASLRDAIISKDGEASDGEVRAALKFYEDVANSLMNPLGPTAMRKDGSATSALLSINKATAKSGPLVHILSPAVEKAVGQLSELAQSILEHPPVFISPEILRLYVDLQSILRRPESLPSVFHLYANKPVPVEGSSPIRYKNPNPNKSSNAIENNVADRALQTAVDAKQLVVAMDIVDTTYNTKAFRRAKFIRKALFPVVGLSLAPVAAYAVASKLSLYQTTMDPTVATNIAFVGILGYIGFTTVVGVVAITTANDQMERITWTPGMPLRERWIREEERAACDRIAGAWGFREIWKRGEEEGEEWDALREWVGHRGMILDRTELMEGME